MNKQELTNRSLISVITLSVGILILITNQFGWFGWIIEIVLVLVFAYTIAPILGEQAAKPAGSLYTGNQRQEKMPRLSAAESAAKRQEYARAAELYREAQQEFPAYLPLYPPLFEILVNRLGDMESARAVYRIGWNAVSGEERKKLEHLFQEFIRK